MLDARHEGGAYRQMEVITGRRRRQNWPAEEKARIVVESLEANISEIAHRSGVSRGLLTVWRRQARELGMAPAPQAMFAAVRIDSDDDVAGGRRLRLAADQARRDAIDGDATGGAFETPSFVGDSPGILIAFDHGASLRNSRFRPGVAE